MRQKRGLTLIQTHGYRAFTNRNIVTLLTDIFEAVKFNDKTHKKVVLLTGIRLPNITDRPETLLFDWEDLQVAGGLDKLAEVIDQTPNV